MAVCGKFKLCVRNYAGYASLEKVIFKKTDFSNIVSMQDMFRDCSNLSEVVNLKASSENLTTVESLFDGCYRLKEINVKGLNTENVTNFCRMFMYCKNIRTLDLSNLKTSSATDMSWMFDYCASLVSVDVSGFNTSNVTNLEYMFGSCFSLFNLDLSSFKTEKCKNFSGMFSTCNSLRELNISSFTVSDDADVSDMFENYVVYKIKLGSGIKKITEKMALRSAPKGWVNEKNPGIIIANPGVNENAEFENSGCNTYIKNPAYGKISGMGININQDGTFGIRVSVTLPDTLSAKEKESATIYVYSRNGYCHSEPEIPVKSDGKGGYYVDFRLYAKEMTARLGVRLKIDGELVDEAGISARQYADYLLSDPVTYAKEQNLVKAMLCFCGAAQRNFNYYYTDDNQCADYGINYSRDKIGTANSFAAPDDLDDLSYYGSSIVLGSGIVQRHYFRLNTGDIGNYTFIVDKKPAVPTQSESDESLYYVDATKNGAAMKLYDASEIKAYKTSEPSKTITFNYSVMAYVGIAKNKGISGKAFEVIKTLSWLADEAKAYFETN